MKINLKKTEDGYTYTASDETSEILLSHIIHRHGFFKPQFDYVRIVADAHGWSINVL